MFGKTFLSLKRPLRVIAICMCTTALAIGWAGCGNSSSSNSASSASQKIKVIGGTSGQEANWTQMSSTGKGFEGFAIDVWNEIAQRNGWEIEYRQGEFAGLWGMLDNDQIDTVVSSVSETAPRMEKYLFSEPCYIDNSVFIYKPSLGTPEDIQFFAGRSVSVGAPTSSKLVMDQLNEKYNLNLKDVNLDRQADVVPSVLSGTSEAGLLDKSSANIAIANLKADLKIFDPKYRVMASAFPFKKTERGTMLMEGASKALTEMKKDGTLKKLAKKWLHDDLSEMPPEYWSHWVQPKE